MHRRPALRRGLRLHPRLRLPLIEVLRAPAVRAACCRRTPGPGTGAGLTLLDRLDEAIVGYHRRPRAGLPYITSVWSADASSPMRFNRRLAAGSHIHRIGEDALRHVPDDNGRVRVQLHAVDPAVHHLPHLPEPVGRLMLGTARCARLDRGVTVTTLNGAQLHLRAPPLDREAVLVSRIIEVPGTVVAIGEEELALVTQFAAGVQALDDVPPEPVPPPRRPDRRRSPSRPAAKAPAAAWSPDRWHRRLPRHRPSRRCTRRSTRRLSAHPATAVPAKSWPLPCGTAAARRPDTFHSRPRAAPPHHVHTAHRRSVSARQSTETWRPHPGRPRISPGNSTAPSAPGCRRSCPPTSADTTTHATDHRPGPPRTGPSGNSHLCSGLEAGRLHQPPRPVARAPAPPAIP